VAEQEFIVMLTFGWQRSFSARSLGQRVQLAKIFSDGSEEAMTVQTVPGQYLTEPKDRGSKMWFLAKVPFVDQEKIRLEVFSGYRTKGEDLQLTFRKLYVVAAGAPIREFSIPNVGVRGVPLLKGRLLEVASVSAKEIKENALDNFVKDEEGM
jgi:hypothetical protein